MAELRATISRGNPETSGAEFSLCMYHRYRLWRCWDPAGERITWVLLNPSTADENVLDPTLRRVQDYSKRWGFGRFDVVNLFAWRATDPKDLRERGFPVGPENNATILEAVSGARAVVAAWGASTWGPVRARAAVVNILLADRNLQCLRTSKRGDPVHPLYQPANLTLQPWASAVRRSHG